MWRGVQGHCDRTCSLRLQPRQSGEGTLVPWEMMLRKVGPGSQAGPMGSGVPSVGKIPTWEKGRGAGGLARASDSQDQSDLRKGAGGGSMGHLSLPCCHRHWRGSLGKEGVRAGTRTSKTHPAQSSREGPWGLEQTLGLALP